MTTAPATPLGDDVTTTPCKGGPLLVRGATEVEDSEGRTYAVERPVVALCRCGRTDRAPWCDNSHKTPRRDDS